MTPDHYFPGTGTLIQQKLGLRPLPALDIRQQCAGFAYGLQVVDALIRGGIARTVLLVGADVHTSLMPFSDAHLRGAARPRSRARCRPRTSSGTRASATSSCCSATAPARWSSGAEDGGRTASRGILAAALYGDGNHRDILYVPGGGSARRPFVSLRDDRRPPRRCR